MSDSYTLEIEEEHAGQRLDKTIAGQLTDLSRARIQGLIAQGHVRVNAAQASNASKKLKAGDKVELTVPAAVDAEPEPEDIPLDVVYEDEDLLVINKQAGLVVHPGAGNWTGTLVNALLHHCKDSLSGIGGVMRPGIVHRLDKDTTGLIVVAKHDQAHNFLAEQLKDRSLSREYKALVLGVPTPRKGVIDHPLGRDPSNRLKMAVRRDGKEARTHYTVAQEWGQGMSLLACKLESGRTHQIRVHCQCLKNHLVGDPLYGPQPTALHARLKNMGAESEGIDFIVNFPRQALHAEKIGFIHPKTEEPMTFSATLPEDMVSALNLLDKINA